MEKNFVQQLNEIGSKIGYPFAYFGDGRVLKVDEDYQPDDDTVVVVFAQIPDGKSGIKPTRKKLTLVLEEETVSKKSCRKSMKITKANERYWPELREGDLLWKELFPRHNNLNVATVYLTRKEEKFLIGHARWRIVYNYFKYHGISLGAAQDLIMRNDDYLLLHLFDIYGVYSSVLQEVIVYQMNDERFAEFISNWAEIGNRSFFLDGELALLNQHSKVKFEAYIDKFNLSKEAEKALIDLGYEDFFKAYVKRYKLSYVIQKLLKNSSKTNLIEIYEACK